MNTERGLTHLTLHLTIKTRDGAEHSGTGFLLGYEQPDGQSKLFCVTNRHVLEGAVVCSAPITLQNLQGYPAYGKKHFIYIEDIAETAIFHPDSNIDLAAFPIQDVINRMIFDGNRPFFRVFNRKDIPNKTTFANIDTAADVLMIGYPNSLWDENNNLPIVRRGITATSPSLDFNGLPQFVIDCACFPGSSGSPIFTYQTGIFQDGENIVMPSGPRIELIGILFAGPQIAINGQIVPKAIPTSLSYAVQSSAMMHLGFCIKSTELAWLDHIVNGHWQA